MQHGGLKKTWTSIAGADGSHKSSGAAPSFNAGYFTSEWLLRAAAHRILKACRLIAPFAYANPRRLLTGARMSDRVGISAIPPFDDDGPRAGKDRQTPSLASNSRRAVGGGLPHSDAMQSSSRKAARQVLGWRL
jgi:hypothetical protein